MGRSPKERRRRQQPPRQPPLDRMGGGASAEPLGLRRAGEGVIDEIAMKGRAPGRERGQRRPVEQKAARRRERERVRRGRPRAERRLMADEPAGADEPGLGPRASGRPRKDCDEPLGHEIGG
nr:hypothetical protein [Chenggangzhangella methanolivorans]